MKVPGRIGRLVIGAALATTACKRQQTAAIDDSWDQAPKVEHSEALQSLSPPWTETTRTQLENGLVAFRLQEDETPLVHVRVLLPTTSRAESMPPAAAAIVAHTMRNDLHRRLGRAGIRAELSARPGRFELSIHATRETRAAATNALLRALSTRPSPARMDAIRRELRKSAGGDVGFALLTGTLLGFPVTAEAVSSEALDALTRAQLLAAWQELTNPQHAVLIVHEDLTGPDWLAAWSQSWRARDRPDTTLTAVGRLRTAPVTAPATTRLLADPPAPLLATPGKNATPVVLMGRRVPATTPGERAIARLAQRIFQEEADVRLSISGDEAVFVVRLPVSAREADKSLGRTVDKLSKLANLERTQTHLAQAAGLWIGSRVVAASLDGEDWTALYAEALDLSSVDADAPLALAREAGAMLAIEPAELVEFTRKWLDPRAGDPGWVWVVDGADEKVLRALRRATTVRAP